jgi:hypothetical protein
MHEASLCSIRGCPFAYLAECRVVVISLAVFAKSSLDLIKITKQLDEAGMKHQLDV